MDNKKRNLTFILILLSFVLFSCNFASNLLNPSDTAQSPTEIENNTLTQSSNGQLSEIIFCEDVTDDGECINQSTQFEAGTNTVWAFFTYEDMEDGMSWGRLWMENEEIYIDATDETWQDGEAGWLAYSISDEIPLSGDYSLTIFIDDEAVQEASFSVTEPQLESYGSSAAFGAIQFSSGMDEENNIPIDISTEFTEGVTEVYASFVYLNLTNGHEWSREWLLNGETLVRKDVNWDDPAGDGITYAAYVEEDGLDVGVYTFNLYLDNQLARSANFEVVAETNEEIPQTNNLPVEELVDADLMRAWEMLANSNNELLWRLADLVTSFQIEIRMSDDLSENTLAAYSYSLSSCDISESGKREPGTVYVNRQAWNEQSWEEVAASIAHELTHAYQHLETGYRCDNCSIQKEYEAFFVTIYALEELGAWGLIEEDYSGVVDSEGNIYGDTLWEVIKESYAECPEY